ncbi:MAG: DNA primase [Armatimonadota bacterium]
MAEFNERYDVDEVRERTDLLAVISQHVTLKKQGGRYTGLCPFHQEKSPSFSVDPQKGFWHCFGCGKGGDAFTFVMQLEHLTFPEAMERLAERFGVRPKVTFEAPQRKEERELLLEVNAAAAGAFRKALHGRAGEGARAYLAQRGITLEQADRFGLGYAPEQWDALIKHLHGQRYQIELLVKAGLALERNSGDGHFDRFRRRLMIPIHDRQGRVVAFGGRAMATEDNPKYLNTAETPVFHKGRTLYALHLAADTISKRGRVIIAEGYFDVIACHLAGFTEAVATLGTALSEEHVQILRRLAERVYLVYDADSAGVNAALRSQAMFRESGVDVRIVRLPGNHDPDTFLREEGTDAFEQCLANALSPVEFELERLLAQHPERDTEGRVRLFRAAAKMLQPLPSLERSEYALRLIDRWLGGTRGDVTELQKAVLSEVAALDRAARGRPTHTAPPPADEDTAAPQRVSEVPLEREVMTTIIQDPQLARRALDIIPVEAFSHPAYQAIFIELGKLVAAGIDPDVRRIVTEDEALAARIASLAVQVSEIRSVEDQSPEVIFNRLRDVYERRDVNQFAGTVADQANEYFEKKFQPTGTEQIDPPLDPDAVRDWTARLRERLKKAERGIFGDDV